MFKLVAVGGKLRGAEFTLVEGENIAGREAGSAIHLSVPGISKKHFSITVTGDVSYIKDLGSSNGTFVNGKLVKQGTLVSGDKIALPDLILQVVHVKEKKVFIQKQTVVAAEASIEQILAGGTPPTALPAKLLWIFRYKLMPLVYGINQEYEWRVLFAILLSVFVALTIAFSIFPVLQDSSQILQSEIERRGTHYADDIARLNARALEQKNLDRVDTAFLEKEDGVYSYELFDLDGRIVRPLGQLNDYISDPFSVKAREWAQNDKNKDRLVYKLKLDEGQIGIAKKIQAYDARSGSFENVGIIAIKFAPKSLAVEAAKNSKAYLEALSTSAIIAIIFFGIIYYLTTRPLEEMKLQIEEATRGKLKELESKHLMREIEPLRSTINSLLQRVRELQHDPLAQEDTIEEDGPYISQLAEFLKGAGVPGLVLDSQKQIQKVNTEAEDLTGIRESASVGVNIIDVAREKGFAGTVIELCENTAKNNGELHSGEYELGGHNYKINVCAIVGKDTFAKGFYVTFVRDR